MIHDDFLGLDTSKTKTGLERKPLNAAIRRIRGVADEIARINREGFRWFLLPGSGFEHLRDLPDALKAYADMLERPIKVLGQERYPSLHFYKFQLTQYVIERTSGPHD